MVVVCRAPNAGPRWDLCTYSVPPEIRPRPQPCQATATMATRSAETQYVRCRHPTLVPTKPLANGGMRRNPAALAHGTKSLGRSLETPDHRAWRPVGLNLPTPTYKVGIGNRVFAFDDPFRAAVDSRFWQMRPFSSSSREGFHLRFCGIQTPPNAVRASRRAALAPSPRGKAVARAPDARLNTWLRCFPVLPAAIFMEEMGGPGHVIEHGIFIIGERTARTAWLASLHNSAAHGSAARHIAARNCVVPGPSTLLPGG